MEKYKWSSNGRFIGIIRLSAKGTDVVMKPAAFRTFAKFVTISTERSLQNPWR